MAQTILCVDDDPTILGILNRILSPRGYRVLLAGDGRTALEIARTQWPDLVFLDIAMPGLDGYEVCFRLQETPESWLVPIVFVTALDDEQDRARAFSAGAAGYIVKPFEPAAVLEAAAQHLGSRERWTGLSNRPRAEHGAYSDVRKFQSLVLAKAGLAGDAGRRPSGLHAFGAGLGWSAEAIAREAADFLGLEFVPWIQASEVRLGVLPRCFARANLIVALEREGDEDAFAIADPFDLEVRDTIASVTAPGRRPRIVVATPAAIEAAFAGPAVAPAPPEPSRDASMDEIIEAITQRYLGDHEPHNVAEAVESESSPVAILLDTILRTAWAQKVSDIHIEPSADAAVVRFRVDGHLRVAHSLKPAGIVRYLVSRVKVLSQLDIAEKRLPQDGKFRLGVPGSSDPLSVRVAVSPMHFGEKVVLRLLDPKRALLPLEELGFSPRHLTVYRATIATLSGMILHVGPTGSGKTTSLYAALNEIRSPAINIQTIEDPIEYYLPGVNQLEVNAAIGLTFQRALRSFLRQAPNVILVGEIRDAETAEIAVQAALSGHMIFSTLHTLDAPSTFLRLVDLGVDPSLVASTLTLACAQRLVRRLCLECRESYRPEEDVKQAVGFASDREAVLHRPRGCEACRGTGYRGQVALVEILPMDESMRGHLLGQLPSHDQLKRAAIAESGMTTLYWDAMEKVRRGMTSLEEVGQRVRRDDFDTRPDWMFEGQEPE